MLRAFGATILAAVVCAVLSCWLVLIGWTVMGDAVSHAMLPGVVLAYVLGAPSRWSGRPRRSSRRVIGAVRARAG